MISNSMFLPSILRKTDLNQVNHSKFGNRANTQRITSDVERASDRFDNSTNFCVIYFKMLLCSFFLNNWYNAR